ncbi:MAG: hypothetical protein WC654_06690 [Patescibacteria group bacterium]
MSDYDDEKKKRDAEAAAAMAAADKRRRERQTRTGDTQQLTSQDSTIVAGEQVAVPIEAPTRTNMSVVLSPEAQAAAQADLTRGQSSGRARGLTSNTPAPDEDSVGAEGEDNADWYLRDGEVAAEGDDGKLVRGSEAVAIPEPLPIISSPTSPSRSLRHDSDPVIQAFYASSQRRAIVTGAILAALVAVIAWLGIGVLEQLTSSARQWTPLKYSEVVFTEQMEAEKQAAVVSPSPVSDIAVAAFIPDAMAGEIISVAQVEESAPAVAQVELPRQPLLRPAEIEVASLARREPSTTPSLKIEARQAGVLPTATPAPVRVAATRAGILSVAPVAKKSRGQSSGRARGLTSGARSIAVAPALPSSPPAVAPSAPVVSAGLVPGASYELYDNSDGTITFKCVRNCK